MKKNYSVAIEHKEVTILRREFLTLYSAQRWACKTIGQILACDVPATVLDMRTGEIRTIISR